MLFTRDFTLRLADFGSATFDNRRSFELCSSPGYMAPELTSLDGHLPSAVDVWGAGIITFILLFGHAPYEREHPDDAGFALICAGDWDSFWAHLAVHRDLPSLQARKFIERALQFDCRPSVSELLGDEWFEQPSLDAVSLKQKMTQEIEKTGL